MQQSNNSQGQILAEFVPIFLILIGILFGIVDVGWLALNYSQLYSALRGGMDYGSVADGGKLPFLQCSAIRQQIVQTAQLSGIQNDTSQIRITYDNGNPDYTGKVSCPSTGSDLTLADFQVSSPTELRGWRIVIEINADVQFLTPVTRLFVVTDTKINLKAAKSLAIGIPAG